MSTLHDRAVAVDAGARLVGTSLLKNEFLSITSAQDGRSLDLEIQNFVLNAGFDRYSVMLLHDDFSSAGSCTVVGQLDNAPPEYVEYDDQEAARLDPVMQYCKRPARRLSMAKQPM